MSKTNEFTPWNFNNTKIALEDVNQILISYGVKNKAKCIDMYQRAMTHKSMLQKKNSKKS